MQLEQAVGSRSSTTSRNQSCPSRAGLPPNVVDTVGRATPAAATCSMETREYPWAANGPAAAVAMRVRVASACCRRRREV